MGTKSSSECERSLAYVGFSALLTDDGIDDIGARTGYVFRVGGSVCQMRSALHYRGVC